MASYNNHTTHGWVSLLLNLVLISFLVIIVCCAYGKRKASWCSKKKIMFYILLSLYGLGCTISLLLLFYHQHKDKHFGGDPLIQSFIWAYCGSYVEVVLYYMARIDKEYCFCAQICFDKKYSFVIMPILVLVITCLMVGIYAATQTKAALSISFVIFSLLTLYSIANLFLIIKWNESTVINPCYIVHISMVSVMIVYVGPLLAAIDVCEDCVLLFFVYGTNICSILALVFIYDEEIEKLLKKWSKQQPIIEGGDVDDEEKLEVEKNQKQKNITNIEEEPDTSKGDNDKGDISLEKEDDKPQKDQIVKPEVHIGPTQN